MKAVVFSEHGGRDVLHYTDFLEPNYMRERSARSRASEHAEPSRHLDSARHAGVAIALPQ